MMKKTPKLLYVLMPVFVLMLGIVGCNDATDDAEVSNNLVSVSSFQPLNGLST